jgi:aspartate carbamoyltransferase catalytic subunit
MTVKVKCELWGCEAGEHEVAELRTFPMPGDVVYSRTVIASVWYIDEPGHETVTLLLLAPKSLRDPEFKHRYNFEVAQLDMRPHGNLTILGEYLNIVPAVRSYEQNGGDY